MKRAARVPKGRDLVRGGNSSHRVQFSRPPSIDQSGADETLLPADPATQVIYKKGLEGDIDRALRKRPRW